MTNLFTPYDENNKNINQSVHVCSMFSTCVIHCLESCSVITNITISNLASGAEQAGLSSGADKKSI